MTFGQRIRQLRTARGLTQRELARRLSTNQTLISHLENHGYSVTPKTAAWLEAALDAPGELTTFLSGICPHCHGTGRRDMPVPPGPELLGAVQES